MLYFKGKHFYSWFGSVINIRYVSCIYLKVRFVVDTVLLDNQQERIKGLVEIELDSDDAIEECENLTGIDAFNCYNIAKKDNIVNLNSELQANKNPFDSKKKSKKKGKKPKTNENNDSSSDLDDEDKVRLFFVLKI